MREQHYGRPSDVYHTGRPTKLTALETISRWLLLKKRKTRSLSHPFGHSGVTYELHLWLVGKLVVDFIFVVIELFSLAPTVETLWANWMYQKCESTPLWLQWKYLKTPLSLNTVYKHHVDLRKCTLTARKQSCSSLSEWVNRVYRSQSASRRHFGHESFHAINCTGTDNPTYDHREKIHKTHTN